MPIGNKRNWAKWSDNVAEIFPAITAFAVSVENILSIRVLNRGVRRVVVLMCKNKFGLESKWNCDLHYILGG